MKALTFLGKGKYESVTYCWREQEYTTNLFPEAVARIFKPEKVVVFVTEGVRKESEHFQMLCQRLGELLHPVEIPEGRSEKEFWEVFDRVVAEVEEGEEVLLDITHAFRSIPMIVFTVAAYLRRAKRVAIEHIVYGAFEARDEQNHVPVFDLTPLLDLLDWLDGVEVFLRHGDAEILTEKLIQIQRRAWKQRVGGDLPERLQKVAGCLRELSEALSLNRPLDVMRYANRLLPLLDEALEEIRRWSSPFAVVVQQVREEVQSLAYHNSEDLDAENLCCQLELIRYYLRKGLIVQAVTLAREWLVSWTILQWGGSGSWLSRKQREEAEKALSAACRRLQGEQIGVPGWYDSIPQSQGLTKIWSSLVELRNTLAHCAMSEEPPRISTIKEEAGKIPSWLQSLLEQTVDHTIHGYRVVIDLKELYGDIAKLDELPHYLEKVEPLAGEGKDVVLTGPAPVWLYLAVAHALHGKARRLYYHSPVTGEVLIFDHSAR